MSYNDLAFYLAETRLKNRSEAPLKPSLGINPGRNAPLIKSNDMLSSLFMVRSIPLPPRAPDPDLSNRVENRQRGLPQLGVGQWGFQLGGGKGPPRWGDPFLE